MLDRAPFIRYVSCLIGGILLHEFVLLPTGAYGNRYFLLFLVGLLTAASGTFYFLKKHSFLSGVLLSLVLALLGILTAQLRATDYQEAVDQLSDPYDSYQFTVSTLPEKRTASIRYRVEINQLRRAGAWQPVRVEAMITVPENAAQVFNPGDVVLVNGQAERPILPRNPEEFDYRHYLRMRGVAWTDFLREGSYQVVGRVQKRWNVQVWSMKLSHWADRTFRSYLPDGDSYGLVKAMLLGRRDDLRANLKDSYTLSGAVHVLSVSGLHVGILFLLISKVFGWLRRLKGGRYLYFILVTLLLAFYALVTGLPPSVLRATLMCVLFVAAATFQRRNEGVNTLAVSAFVLLLFDPYALFAVGFQLSYLAVLGIVLFYRPIRQLVEVEDPILSWLWQITVVSFSAQLLTVPLTVYYFHQFPVYFWLVNPFVIAFTTLLLPLTLALLVFSFFSPLANFVGLGTNMVAYLTNQVVTIPKVLPFYLAEDLVLDRVEVGGLFLCLFLTWYMFRFREFKLLKALTLFIVLLAMYSIFTLADTFQKEQMVVYAVPRQDIISVKKDNRLYYLSEGAIGQDSALFVFRLKNYKVKNAIRDTVHVPLGGNGQVGGLQLRQTQLGTLLRWNPTTRPQAAAPDYLLITSRSYPRPESVRHNPAVVYLLGGQLGTRTRARWVELLSTVGNRYHDLTADGAVVETEF
ncbi:ComEC/Rec2 family competence protein [Telluribacter sp.]|jgi:competence protein ComEC|uniref:ComEC/Rec2 family competence protein n=1 Tax=Telluribacter sp. TaxID=1978767 RepID=UPI002E0E72B9|nr:ComEC/Rec2 family competence protein [Telluribacter sp.]